MLALARPDDHAPELARRAWPEGYATAIAQAQQTLGRSAELRRTISLDCIDDDSFTVAHAAAALVRRAMAAPELGLDVKPQPWARPAFAYPLATVNGHRLTPSRHAAGNTVFVDRDDMLTDGRISTTATGHIVPSPGSMALWRAVLRTSDGSPVTDLDWLADDRWHEPLMRLEWFVDPAIELRYIANPRASVRPLTRVKAQSLSLNRNAGDAAASRLDQLAARIPGSLRTRPGALTEAQHVRNDADAMLRTLLQAPGRREPYRDALMRSIGTGPPPTFYARFHQFDTRIGLAQAATICGETVLEPERARTKLLTPAVMANVLWEIDRCDRESPVALDLDQREVAAELIARARRTLAVAPVPGLPGLGTLLVGQPTEAPISAEEVPVRVALDAVAHHERTGRTASIDGEIADVVRMMNAPVRGSGRLPNGEHLHGFQQRLVAQMESTDRGVLVASGTGTGKSAMVVETINRWAGTTPATRVLILVEDELVAQWHDDVLVGTTEEPGFLTNDAITRILTPSCNVAQALREVDAAAGTAPAVFLCGQTVARSAVHALSRTVRREPGGDEPICFWDIFVIDDADFLIGDSAIERAAAMIRENADRGIVANATPYHSSPTDVFKQVGVARGYSRETMRRGRKRLAHLRLASTSQLAALHESYSPVVARPTPDEIEHIMPRLAPPLVHEVPPTELEQRAMEAVEVRLIDAFNMLVDAAERAGALDPESAKGRENQFALDSALRSLRYLGPLASRLACDWEAALASTSNAAQLLALDEDVRRLQQSRQIPTMRRLHAELIAKSVEGGHPILAFCEHIPPLNLLDRELRSRFGITAGLLTGDTPPQERHRLCRAFRNGDGKIDALLIGPKSIRGKNLQRARRVLHVDLPPTPPRFEQRNGRAARIGSCWPEIDVIIGLLAGSYMRFMQERIITSAAAAVAILDGTSARSHIAGQFAALAADHKLGEHATAAGYVAARLIEQRA